MLRKGEEGGENDAEHSFQLALVAWFINDHFKLNLDTNLLLKAALAHDLVELYAGDMSVYEENLEKVESKHDREMQAFKRIKEEFPTFTELHTIIEVYEDQKSPEALFIKSIDKLVPGINIYLDDGRYWKENGVTLDLMKEKVTEKASAHPDMKVMWDELIARLEENEEKYYDTKKSA